MSTRPHQPGLLLPALALCWVFVSTVPAAPADAFIVKHGQPAAEIITAEDPARMARLAATELQTWVERISGARLPILTEPGGAAVKVYVGRSPHSDRLGISVEGLRHGAYRMASGDDWLALLGPDTQFEPVEPYAHTTTSGSRGSAERARIDQEWDQITGETYSNPFHYVWPHWIEELQVWEFDDAGTLNAVYDFLRRLGVRWYFPGELGEIVPDAKDIPLPQVDAVVRPDFPLRKLGWWSRHISMTPEEDLWNLRLGTNHGADLIGLTQLCHGSKFVHLRDEFKAAHPDYFALWGGQRATDHKSGQGAPCLSSEGFFQHHLKYARAVFDHFGEPMLSIDVVDGYGRGVCECELCAGKGTPERGWMGLMSDYVFGYMNRAAQALYASHPDKMVSALSYGAYKLPPERIEQFPPNLALWMCQTRSGWGDRAARDETLRLRDQWLEKLPSRRLFIYEYYLENRPAGTWEGIPVYYPRLIAEDLRSLKGVGLGEYIDLYQPHERGEVPYDYLAICHLNLYVTARLWWDADLDVDALLEDYYEEFYGPARGEMKAFVEYCEQNWPRMRTDVDAIDRALELLTAARQTAGDTICGRRVELIVDYVEPLTRLRAQLANPREGVPMARALVRSARPVIDGRLDDEVWGTVRRCELFEIEAGGRPAHPTSFLIAWIEDALYLGITCTEPDMPGLMIGTTEADSPNIWNGDVVEVLLATQFHSYYQIAVSPSGAVTDLDREKGLNTLWDSGAEIATQRGPDQWTVEIRLPAAGENAKDIDPLHGVAGKQPSETYLWFVNVCRQRVRGGETELSAWSPTGQKRFNVPEKFGKVYAR